jgi:hypothetical protein
MRSHVRGKENDGSDGTNSQSICENDNIPFDLEVFVTGREVMEMGSEGNRDGGEAYHSGEGAQANEVEREAHGEVARDCTGESRSRQGWERDLLVASFCTY